MDHIRRVVVGFGANLGDRHQNIADALEALRADPDIHVTDQSPVYETEPEGGPAQGMYLNGAVLLLTAIEAADLLLRLQGIEAALGRTRDVKNGPRTIDLDILWIEGESIQTESLTVPHPRLGVRAFMLRPLLDVAEDARDSASGLVFSELPLAKVKLSRS